MADDLELLAREAEDLARSRFRELNETAEYNTAKVLKAFRSHRVSEAMFAGSTGYGYDDMGRDTLDAIWAEIFGTEAALVRLGFVNGTHAITCALFAPLRAGDVLLCATGLPYDTLWSALGVHDDKPGSLRSYGVEIRVVDLQPDGTPDLAGIRKAAQDPRVKEVFLQRSRGYTSRPALRVEQLNAVIDAVREVNPGAACVVDNCYGEFTERTEPKGDLLAGSLIKNPGGGLAPMGGYIAGRADLVEAAAFRLTVPGLGGEVGASLGFSRTLYQGLFLAPHTVAQALKTAVFAAALLEKLGYETFPAWDAPRSDIIQSIDFHDPEKLKRFCAGIQQGSPVDSFVTPEPWDMPGYEAPVIMAAGTFIQGASIELSCDGPMLPPYRAYLQGGLTYESGKLGILEAVKRLQENG
jgi:cystathionine beta-lyase family protein involved in aluminum resistance